MPKQSIIPAISTDKFHASERGLVVLGKVDYETWYAYGAGLRRVESAMQWVIGDWLNYGEKKYGETYAQAEKLWNGNSKQSLMNYKWVASRIEISRRREISWSHHAEVAPLDPHAQDKWLQHAQEQHISVHDLRSLIHPAPSKPNENEQPDYEFNRQEIIEANRQGAAIEVPPVDGREMKPKINRTGDIYIPAGYDACQTPAYAIDPLLPFLPGDWTIWEPACGENFLVDAFCDASRKVVSGDILIGENFFEYQPDEWDCQITNPPYSIKYDWLSRSYELQKPFALLLPVETLGAKTAQILFAKHGLEVIFLDKRVNFKMPNKGWDSSAQFPVAWFTWELHIGAQMVFAHIEYPVAEQE